MGPGVVTTRREPASTRFFTVEEAERTLPLVRRILSDAVDRYAELQERGRELNAILRREPEDDGAVRRAAALRDAMEEDSRRIEAFVAELEQVGCTCKGLDTGLIDFRGRYRCRTVLLCWKLGEAGVEWWHEERAGFAGRQRITDEFRRELREG